MSSLTKKWIDVSVPLYDGMVSWLSDPKVKIKEVKSLKKGNRSNVSLLSISSHAGTHMDAPLHFLKKGKSLDKITLDAIIGDTQVIHIKNKKSVTLKELKKHKIQKGGRILFKTINSSRCWKIKKFIKNFVSVSEEAARYLSKIGIRVVGIDYLSVGSMETHNIFLKKDIWIIEGLNLSKVKEGKYEMICLPLKILNSNGAPARVVLRKRS